MGRLKSFLNGVLVDTAGRAHDCQHNRRHRLTKGDRRLKVTGTDEHFCVTCALQMIERDKQRLSTLEQQLRGELPLEAEQKERAEVSA